MRERGHVFQHRRDERPRGYGREEEYGGSGWTRWRDRDDWGRFPNRFAGDDDDDDVREYIDDLPGMTEVRKVLRVQPRDEGRQGEREPARRDPGGTPAASRGHAAGGGSRSSS